MRDAFIDFGKLMQSAFFRDRLKMVFGKENQTLYSRRIEDEIYREVYVSQTSGGGDFDEKAGE